MVRTLSASSTRSSPLCVIQRSSLQIADLENLDLRFRYFVSSGRFVGNPDIIQFLGLAVILPKYRVAVDPRKVLPISFFDRRSIMFKYVHAIVVFLLGAVARYWGMKGPLYLLHPAVSMRRASA